MCDFKPIKSGGLLFLGTSSILVHDDVSSSKRGVQMSIVAIRMGGYACLWQFWYIKSGEQSTVGNDVTEINVGRSGDQPSIRCYLSFPKKI